MTCRLLRAMMVAAECPGHDGGAVEREGKGMSKGILGDREKALEENYFRQQDAKLLQQLRAGGGLDEIASALAAKLQVDQPELINRARDAGVTADTAAALLLAPLVQTAWAEGSVHRQEREAVLRLAQARRVEQGSAAYLQLQTWLEQQPTRSFFDTALDILAAGLAVLPVKEREERIKRIMDACHEVAEASGSQVARLLGLGDGVSRPESSVLDVISNRLHGRS